LQNLELVYQALSRQKTLRFKTQMMPFTAPLDADYLLRKKRALRREMLAGKTGYEEKRIAILGGSTTAELRDMLELFLLNSGIRPVFYESDYNRYFEDLAFEDSPLKNFQPDFIYLHTSNLNITQYPSMKEDADAIQQRIDKELEKFQILWDNAERYYNCPVIQNNFDLPHSRALGNLDCYAIQGRGSFVAELNRRFAEQARLRKNLYLNDIHYLSAWVGLERWHDLSARYAYKYAMSLRAIPHVAHSAFAIINAILGKSKKCLVLDLDNTLWGGVIGDDGVGGIELGAETATAEGYSEFQRYVRDLNGRGIVLAVCSKNDEANAKEGFTHPDSILTVDDFSIFQANWNEKHVNLRRIAETLNVGIDSLVFVDDNPVERALIRAQEPLVTVPEVSGDVTRFIAVLDKSGLFEPVSLSDEDLRRGSLYADNAKRSGSEARFEDYNAFLKSLDMVAEIEPLNELVIERAVQLCNKTNQFNVTTKRVTTAQMNLMITSPDVISIYGRLKDKFGDNGLISVMSGTIRDKALHIDIWLMSCRVLKRGMEGAMLDRMAGLAKARGIACLVGYYRPTAKNKMVSGLFSDMGFKSWSGAPLDGGRWILDLGPYENRNSIIRVNHD
jgi:FkbH-like protein